VVGDGQSYFFITKQLTGLNLVELVAFVVTVSTSGPVQLQFHNSITGDADILTTKLTIDAGAHDSYTSGTQYVIDPAHALMTKGDIIRIDIDAAGTGAMGLGIAARFE
jgi:hypothetical protein